MPLRLESLAIDARDPEGLARFWGAMLHRDVVSDAAGLLLAGEEAQLSLRFVLGHAVQVGRNRMHLHLTSTDPDDQHRVVETALGLGARHRDVGQRPQEGHVVLDDPEGNEFCVLRPGSDFVAGCGLLGELACDGTREVGLFWSRALGWPLVWDQEEETAIQSPRGGTKIAWGGPPLAPRTRETSRQQLQLGPADGDDGDLRQEVDRLLSLGATRDEDRDDGSVTLTDPDGNEFRVTTRYARRSSTC